jgi:hypothetical protein
MKRILNFWSVAMVIALCVGFSSCEKDDDELEGGGSGDFIEVTINGETYKDDVLGWFGFDTSPVSADNIFQQETANFFCDIYLSFYKNNSSFKNSTPGTYRVIGSWEDFFDKTEKNFDLLLLFNNDNPSYREFQLQSGAVHNVTDIKFIKVNTDGSSKYAVSGNFSCQHKDQKTGEIYNTTGKYRYTVTVL